MDRKEQGVVTARALLIIVLVFLVTLMLVSMVVQAVADRGDRLALSFAARWVDLPPAIEGPAMAHATLPRPVVVVAVRKTGICERHGMRRVEYSKGGRKMWRCRR